MNFEIVSPFGDSREYSQIKDSGIYGIGFRYSDLGFGRNAEQVNSARRVGGGEQQYLIYVRIGLESFSKSVVFATGVRRT